MNVRSADGGARDRRNIPIRVRVRTPEIFEVDNPPAAFQRAMPTKKNAAGNSAVNFNAPATAPIHAVPTNAYELEPFRNHRIARFNHHNAKKTEHVSMRIAWLQNNIAGEHPRISAARNCSSRSRPRARTTRAIIPIQPRPNRAETTRAVVSRGVPRAHVAAAQIH
jgi:hypothetical protein